MYKFIFLFLASVLFAQAKKVSPPIGSKPSKVAENVGEPDSPKVIDEKPVDPAKTAQTKIEPKAQSKESVLKKEDVKIETSPSKDESKPVEIIAEKDGKTKKKVVKTITKSNEEDRTNENQVASDLIPEGQELVNINFPELTDIKDIIHAVALWTGKNVILGRDISGKVQMISPRKVTKVEAYQAFLSALNLLGLTTVETGKVIKIVSVRQALKSNLKTFLGSSWTPLTDELITQIVPLKYVNASEIQRKLAKIVTANSVIAYEPTNTLIISDSGYKVKRILDIIQLLDVQTQQPKLSIVPIKNGDAKVIGNMVSDIFKAQNGTKKSKASYLTYKIMTDERTNSVVIFGPPRTIADVKKLVRQFDVQVDDPSKQAAIHVRPLDYADATKLAQTLKSLSDSSNSRSSRRYTPPIGSRKSSSKTSSPAVATLDNNVKITADESSNSLLITGSRAAYESINSIIRKLDIRRSQVFVETEILDINIDGGFKFGTSVFAGAGREDGTGTKMAYTWEAANMAPLIVGQTSQTTDPKSKADAAGVFGSDLNIGILSGQSVNVPGLGTITPGALIKMIKTDSNARVLSSPHILTANNEEAVFSVGDKLFYQGGSSIASAGTVVNNVKSEKVDLTLNIKPNISHSNYVTLKIELDANTGEIDPTSNLPKVLNRKTSQIVTVKNSQTVVISGLVQSSEQEIFSKIPLLGDIPILGWLFRNSTMRKKTSNLMIFLTPHIVHGANDLAQIYATKIKERDELFAKVYGSSFNESEFYERLPKKEDGIFTADGFDVLDQRMRKKRQKELMRDMGYTTGDIDVINEPQDEDPEESDISLEEKVLSIEE